MHKYTFLLFALVLAALAPAPLPAQDKYSIPGVEDASSGAEAAAPASPVDSGGSAAAPVVYKNLLDKVIRQGGWAIWPLLGLSVLVVGLSAYLLIDLQARNFFPAKLVKSLKEDMDHGDVHAAMDRSKKSSTCLGQIMYGATEYIGDRGFQVLDDNGLYDSMADASQEFNRGRAGVINWISVVAQAAPMMGLLGTVSGMIKAFDKLGQKGMGDPAQLASNISEALWTTATGLVIAVPSLAIYYYFRGRLGSLVARSDQQAYKLLNSLRRTIVSRSAHQPEIS